MIQLSAVDERANVTGYAAVARPIDDRQIGKSVGQLIAALNTEADTPINLVDSAQTDERALNDVLSRLAELGLNNVDFEPVERARERAIGRNAPEELTGFIDCPVPKGLLAAHDRLEIADLAPAVGAALARLGLGFSAERSTDEHVAIWVPDADAHLVVDSAAPDPQEQARKASSFPEPEAPEPEAADLAANTDLAENTDVSELRATDDLEDGPAVEMPAIVPAETVALDATGTDDPEDHDDESAAAVRPLVMAIALLALIGFGLLAFLFFGGTGDEAAEPAAVAPAESSEPDEVLAAEPSTDATAASATAEPVAPTEVPTPEEPAPTATAEPTPEPTMTPEPSPEPEPEPAAETEALVPLSELPERGAIYRASEGLLYLQGPVTAEEAAVLETRAIEVLGPDRVVNEYVIRDDAPPVTEGNVRVEQAVLFETGSAAIADDFVPTLELGVLVLNLNPQVTMIVEGHTDDVGSEAINQALSEQRAQAVVEYLVSRGVDRERLVPIGLGETEPIGDNTTELGRQLNRRIEVDLVDLLSPRPDDEGEPDAG